MKTFILISAVLSWIVGIWFLTLQVKRLIAWISWRRYLKGLKEGEPSIQDEPNIPAKFTFGCIEEDEGTAPSGGEE